MTFKDFVNKRNSIPICENRDLNKLEDMFNDIRTAIRKHTNNAKIVFLSGLDKTYVDGYPMLTKFVIISGTNNLKLVGLNILRDERYDHIYSIDFFNSYDVLYPLSSRRTRASLSVYTLGESISYFLPIVCGAINADTTILDNIDVQSERGNVKESKSFKFSIGSLIYSIVENLPNESINKSFMTIANRQFNNAREYGKAKAAEKADAYSHRNDSPEAMEKYKKLLDEVKEVWDAIHGGANTIPELKAAIHRNTSVVVELDEIMRKQQKQLETEHDDPEFVFKKMRQYVKMVIKGINPSVILCGAPGVGKTYNVKQLLKASGYREGTNLCTITGRCSPRALYMAMYQYRAKGDILLIDDADSLVGPRAPEDCINILKGALDSTSDDEGRLVMYGVAGKLLDDDGDPIPKKMHYNGSIIIITNYNAGALDTALRGRSFIMDINFTTEDLLKIVKRLMPAIDPEHLSSRAKIKAYDYLKEMADNDMDMEISIRTFAICAKLFETCFDDPDFTEDETRKMIDEQMKLQASRRNRNSKY